MEVHAAQDRRRFRVLAVAVAFALATLVAACVSVAGRRFTDASDDGRERAQCIGLGGAGTVANLSQGYPWVPEAALARLEVDGRDAGNVFFAKVIMPVQTFGFRQLSLKGPAGERTIPGSVRKAFCIPGFFDPRCTEVIEVPLQDADVRWMVEAGIDLELRMESDDAWIQLPPGGDLANAVAEYARLHLEGAASRADAAPAR